MDSEKQVIELTQKISALQFGFKVLASVVLSITSLGNIVASFSIYYFWRIFADVLHGEPLPLTTYFVCHYQSLLIALAFIWPIVGISALFIKKNIRLAVILLAVAQAGILLQWGLIIYSDEVPMMRIFSSIQDSSSS